MVLILALVAGLTGISGCTGQSTPGGQGQQNLKIVLKDVGLPEVKYLQPTILGVQLKSESGKWVTLWSSPEGKTVKLTPDGAEVVLDAVKLEAGTYAETRLLVSGIDVVADINRDGDTLDKNVQVVLTEQEFASLPQGEKPQAPQQPSAPPSPPAAPTQPPTPQKPQKPSAPGGSGGGSGERPQEPSEPQQPTPPPQPSAPTPPPRPTPPPEPLPPGVAKIENGLVYMDEFLDEVSTAIPPYLDGIHNDSYLYPLMKERFAYGGSGGRIVYDFTLRPLKPKHEQISVEVSAENPPPPSPTPFQTSTPPPTPISSPSLTPTSPPVSPPPLQAFGVKIGSLTCQWSVKVNEYGTKSDCVRIVSKGTAQGPVGVRVELPILSWSDDKFDCGNWTLKTGALIAVGSTCVRQEGQPETTTWTVDTEGNECLFKNYFNNNRTYDVKIYKDEGLYPEKEDVRNTLCQ